MISSSNLNTRIRVKLHANACNYQGRVVQRLDNAIHRINRYPADKCWQNKPRYPLDSDLSAGQRYPAFEQPGPDQ